MARAFGCRTPALIVDLSSGDVPMPQQILHLDDIDTGVQQQGSRSSPEGVGSINALPCHRSVVAGELLCGAGEPVEVAADHMPHGPRRHGSYSELLTTRIKARPEEGTRSDAGLLDVLADRLRRMEVNAHGTASVSLHSMA